jgi:hypothetical protein
MQDLPARAGFRLSAGFDCVGSTKKKNRNFSEQVN